MMMMMWQLAFIISKYLAVNEEIPLRIANGACLGSHSGGSGGSSLLLPLKRRWELNLIVISDRERDDGKESQWLGASPRCARYSQGHISHLSCPPIDRFALVAFLDETYLSHPLFQALSPAVALNGMIGGTTKKCVEVFVEDLQSDGGVFTAAVLGASLALVDAGKPMRDVVCAGNAAVMKVESTAKRINTVTTRDGEVTSTAQQKMISQHVIAEQREEGILEACYVLTIALVTVWDQFGKISMNSSSEATEMARVG